MAQTVSARISKEMHDDLRERCNDLGCTINDFIENSVEASLYDSEAEPTKDDNRIEASNPEPAKVTNWKIIDDDGNVIATSSEKILDPKKTLRFEPVRIRK